MSAEGTLLNASEEVLAEDQRSRTDTKWFVIQVLKKMGYRIWIDYSELKNMPSFESIIRSKRIIQHERNLYNEKDAFKPEEGVTYEPKRN